MNKAKIVGWVIASPFILIGVGIAFCEANKAYLDYQVKQMCEKDGGVTVYEHIELTPEEFKNLGGNTVGEIDIPTENHRKMENPFIYRSTLEILHSGYPEVRRYEDSIVLREQEKILSRRITYGRVGGDFPTGIIFPSAFSCNEMKEINTRLIKSTVIVKGE